MRSEVYRDAGMTNVMDAFASVPLVVQKATRAAAMFLVKAQATERIHEQIRAALISCPGDCAHCHELAAIDQVLDELDIDRLLQTHLKVSE